MNLIVKGGGGGGGGAGGGAGIVLQHVCLQFSVLWLSLGIFFVVGVVSLFTNMGLKITFFENLVVLV